MSTVSSYCNRFEAKSQRDLIPFTVGPCHVALYYLCLPLTGLGVMTHIFNVEMTCEGCSGAVERVLNRLKGKGVDSISISLPEQKVSVTSTLSSDELLEVIKKTGKNTNYIGTQ